MKGAVLLVDDEKDYVSSLSRQLTIREYDVTTAYSGDEAIGKLKQREFDVIILDVLMPGRDGIDTFREIKRIDPAAKVIMHTGHAKVDLAVDELKNGIHDYVIKPVTIEELIEKIELALTARKLAKEQRG